MNLKNNYIAMALILLFSSNAYAETISDFFKQELLFGRARCLTPEEDIPPLREHEELLNLARKTYPEVDEYVNVEKIKEAEAVVAILLDTISKAPMEGTIADEATKRFKENQNQYCKGVIEATNRLDSLEDIIEAKEEQWDLMMESRMKGIDIYSESIKKSINRFFNHTGEDTSAYDRPYQELLEELRKAYLEEYNLKKEARQVYYDIAYMEEYEE